MGSTNGSGYNRRVSSSRSSSSRAGRRSVVVGFLCSSNHFNERSFTLTIITLAIIVVTIHCCDDVDNVTGMVSAQAITSCKRRRHVIRPA
jgi:hypothetical protein